MTLQVELAAKCNIDIFLVLSLQFKLEGKVKRCSGGEKHQSIAAYHIVNIDRSDHNCISAYVRTNESGYSLYVTGKNG